MMSPLLEDPPGGVLTPVDIRIGACDVLCGVGAAVSLVEATAAVVVRGLGAVESTLIVVVQVTVGRAVATMNCVEQLVHQWYGRGCQTNGWVCNVM